MNMPLIGIEVDLEANAKGRRYSKCYETYFDAVSAAGGAPLLVPPMPRPQAERGLETLHGLVVPGGADFAAEDWGEPAPGSRRRTRGGWWPAGSWSSWRSPAACLCSASATARSS